MGTLDEVAGAGALPAALSPLEVEPALCAPEPSELEEPALTELFVEIPGCGAIEAAALEHHADRAEQLAQPSEHLVHVVNASSLNACTTSNRSPHSVHA